MNTCQSKTLEKISKQKEDGRQDKWVGFYHKCHIQKNEHIYCVHI
jgi:hypothetical protein